MVLPTPMMPPRRPETTGSLPMPAPQIQSFCTSQLLFQNSYDSKSVDITVDMNTNNDDSDDNKDIDANNDDDIDDDIDTNSDSNINDEIKKNLAEIKKNKAEIQKVLKYLVETRGLQTRTLRKYGVGTTTHKFCNDQNQWQSSWCVTFPWILTQAQVDLQDELRHQPDNHTHKKNHSPQTSSPPPPPSSDTTTTSPSSADSLVTRRIKLRSVENKAWQRLDPPGGGWGFFGLHTVPPDATEVVITEGEYDAMAVWQATGRPAISLPNGCRSLPIEVLPLIEHFDKIYLWMDNDRPGKEGAEQFARKIGIERCYLVQPPLPGPKDANEALLQNMNLEEMIRNAQLTPHERISTFDELRQDVLDEIIYPDKYVGSPMKSLATLTKIMKGFRRGEMTVITGPTGSGKTTFLGQLSLDMAEQGVNMLWGSFEIKNTRLLHKLLQQFAREPLPSGDPSQLPKLEAIANRFQRLPLHFLKFHGGSDVDDVLDAMEYAVYVNDVEHIILDNMQFMISRSSTSRSSTFDKFDVQDMAIEKFRKFATEKNVHISLVVHPRKEQEASTLSMSSIYGSAKATQEADTVLILQYDGRRKWIDVKKNRFTGDLGHVSLYFDRQSNRYSEDASVQTKPTRVGSVGGGSPPSAYNKDHWNNSFR